MRFDYAGLGLRSASRHSSAGLIASRTATKDLCLEVDLSFLWDISDASELSRAFAHFNSLVPESVALSLTSDCRYQQKALSTTLDKVAFARRLESVPTSRRAATFSETLPGASGFLTAIPSRTSGLAMEAA